jgi:methylase of polypeptide subunit release factors
VREGRSVVARPVDDRGAAWLRAFIAAMDWRARQHAPWVVASLDLTGVARVLDVGGGSGAYAAEFVRAKPGVTATVFDLPNVLALTAEHLAQSGVQDRVTLVPGDYERDDLGQGFDVVLLSAIIHSNPPGATPA